MKRKTVLLLGVLLVLVPVTIATFLKSYTVNAVGRIVGVRVSVWSDSNASVALTSLDWGFIEPDETKNYSVWIRRDSNVRSIFRLETKAWNTINTSEFLTLTWDYDNVTVNPQEIIEIVFSLYVDPSVWGIDFFSFDIVIEAKKVGWGS